MKAAEGYIFKEIHAVGVIVPVGEKTGSFNGMFTLNETGAFLWKQLEHETDRASLIAALIGEYDTDEATAAKDVDAFLDKLRAAGLLSD